MFLLLNKELLLNMVLKAVEEMNDHLDDEIPIQEGENAPIYEYLDSFGLVSLLVCIEQAIEDECNISLDLASLDHINEQNSPFKTVETLVNYILEVSKSYALTSSN